MNKEQITKILIILKTSYPYAFKDMNKQELESMINLYQEMFKEDSYEVVSKAILDLIKTSEYLPTIASIKNKIYNLTHKDDINNSELWECLLKAIQNGSYHAEEEFEKLPDIVKSYIRSPRQLQELAIVDSDTIHTVVKGQFLKQIENIKQQHKENIIRNNLLNNKETLKIGE